MLYFKIIFFIVLIEITTRIAWSYYLYTEKRWISSDDRNNENHVHTNFNFEKSCKDSYSNLKVISKCNYSRYFKPKGTRFLYQILNIRHSRVMVKPVKVWHFSSRETNLFYALYIRIRLCMCYLSIVATLGYKWSITSTRPKHRTLFVSSFFNYTIFYKRKR